MPEARPGRRSRGASQPSTGAATPPWPEPVRPSAPDVRVRHSRPPRSSRPRSGCWPCSPPRRRFPPEAGECRSVRESPRQDAAGTAQAPSRPGSCRKRSAGPETATCREPGQVPLAARPRPSRSSGPGQTASVPDWQTRSRRASHDPRQQDSAADGQRAARHQADARRQASAPEAAAPRPRRQASPPARGPCPPATARRPVPPPARTASSAPAPRPCRDLRQEDGIAPPPRGRPGPRCSSTPAAVPGHRRSRDPRRPHGPPPSAPETGQAAEGRTGRSARLPTSARREWKVIRSSPQQHSRPETDCLGVIWTMGRGRHGVLRTWVCEERPRQPWAQGTLGVAVAGKRVSGTERCGACGRAGCWSDNRGGLR